MARGFGSTLGSGTTDSVAPTYTAHNQTSSFALWTNRHGVGGSSAGRLWDKRTSVDVHRMSVQATALYRFRHFWSGSSAGWDIAEPAADSWHHILVTYDYGSTTNDPIIYVDGASVTVTEVTAPVGAANTTAEPWVIGNRLLDNAVNWDGELCEWAMWSRILTSTEAAGIGTAHLSPLFYPANLVTYVPMIGTENVDYYNTAPTVTGALVTAGPGIIYPHTWARRVA